MPQTKCLAINRDRRHDVVFGTVRGSYIASLQSTTVTVKQPCTMHALYKGH